LFGPLGNRTKASANQAQHYSPFTFHPTFHPTFGQTFLATKRHTSLALTADNFVIHNVVKNWHALDLPFDNRSSFRNPARISNSARAVPRSSGCPAAMRPRIFGAFQK